jgi:hypothetical protein
MIEQLRRAGVDRSAPDGNRHDSTKVRQHETKANGEGRREDNCDNAKKRERETAVRIERGERSPCCVVLIAEYAVPTTERRFFATDDTDGHR